MVQILPQQDLGSILGEALGGGIQAGMGGGLQSLIQERQAAKQRGILGKSLQQFGFSPEEAESFSALPPQMQAQILKSRMPSPGTEAALSILGLGGPSQTGERIPSKEISPQESPELSDQEMSALSLINPQLARSLMEQKKFKLKEREIGLRETRKEREGIVKSASKSQEQVHSLDQMAEAVKSGELGPLSKAAFSEMLPEFGPFKILKRSLVSPTAAQFKTATKAMMAGAKEIFGARITDYDAKLFQEMLPQIGRNKESNLAAIDVLKDIAEAKVEKRKILDRIIEETPEKDLSKLGRKVEAEYDKYLDQQHKTMRNKMESVTQKGKAADQGFGKLPKAEDYKGKIIKDTKTGKRYESTGKGWRIVE